MSFFALHIIRKNEILNTFQESRCVYCCSKGREQCLFLMAAWLQHYRLHRACSLSCIKTNCVMLFSQEFKAQLICLSLLTLKYILLGWGKKKFACYFGKENFKSLKALKGNYFLIFFFFEEMGRIERNVLIRICSNWQIFEWKF